MTLLGRETPELPAEVLFADLELTVLEAFATTRQDLPAPTSLAKAIFVVAKLGGYLGRQRDPPPGHQLMWQGHTTLRDMCRGAALSIRGP